MAKAAMDSVSRRDPNKKNNVMDLGQVQVLTPSFRWKDYLAAVNAPTPQHCIVTSPDFFRVLEKLIQGESLDTWKTCLAYWVIDRNSPYMGQAFQDANFEFRNKTMLGQKEPLPRLVAGEVHLSFSRTARHEGGSAPTRHGSSFR